MRAEDQQGDDGCRVELRQPCAHRFGESVERTHGAPDETAMTVLRG